MLNSLFSTRLTATDDLTGLTNFAPTKTSWEVRVY